MSKALYTTAKMNEDTHLVKHYDSSKNESFCVGYKNGKYDVYTTGTYLTKDLIVKAKAAAEKFHQLKAQGRSNVSQEYNGALERMMKGF